MINGGALGWSVTVHAAVAAALLAFGGEPRTRVPPAGLSLFDASPLPLMSEGAVPPVASVPSQLRRPCPASPPRERQPRLARPAVPEQPFLGPVAGCIRVAADGRVDAVGFRPETSDAARRRLVAFAGELRFIPATRDGVAIPAWLGIAFHRRRSDEPPPGFIPLP